MLTTIPVTRTIGILIALATYVKVIFANPAFAIQARADVTGITYDFGTFNDVQVLGKLVPAPKDSCNLIILGNGDTWEDLKKATRVFPYCNPAGPKKQAQGEPLHSVAKIVLEDSFENPTEHATLFYVLGELEEVQDHPDQVRGSSLKAFNLKGKEINLDTGDTTRYNGMGGVVSVPPNGKWIPEELGPYANPWVMAIGAAFVYEPSAWSGNY
ncbi:hypothetical protein QFC21_001211 [Naganishia friedmannii]|uniref:Uncharacterized protein n=1 Tax=Naganishia friedmannii TaxID=89922 RepID=A0ACC2W2Z0_9TREE|nr:hypothetical protein QFC21_001211 [Naganishia friedmannii]